MYTSVNCSDKRAFNFLYKDISKDGLKPANKTRIHIEDFEGVLAKLYHR